MRIDRLTTGLDLAGMGMLTLGGFYITQALGWAVAGACCLVTSWRMSRKRST